MKNLLLILAMFAFSATASAMPRDDAQKREFRRNNPCPSTGKTTGACKHYQIDHIKALMNGGADRPENMQWLSTKKHRAKTRGDYAECVQSYFCKNKRVKKRLPWQRKKHRRQ